MNLHNISAFDFLQANMHDLKLENMRILITPYDILMMTMEMLKPKLVKITALSHLLF